MIVSALSILIRKGVLEMGDLKLADYVLIQVALVRLPVHLKHLEQETGKRGFTDRELLSHFAGHANKRGRTFASIFAKLYRRYKDAVLSDDNWWFAGIFFQGKPTLVRATLYYLAQRKKFGLSLETLAEVLVQIE